MSAFGPTALQGLAQSQAALTAQQQAYMNQAMAQQTAAPLGLQQGLAGATRTYFNIPIVTSSAVTTGSVFVSTSTSNSTGAGTVWVNPQSMPMMGAALGQGTVVGGGGGGVIQRGRSTIRDGEQCEIVLPDGTVIDVKPDGSYTIEDKDAKIVYRANRLRDFNPFINVSDRLEEFIAFCGDQGVRRGEMLEIPIKLFIAWIALEAARADREPEPDLKLLPDLRRRALPRCPACQRFVSAAKRAVRIEFCAPACFERHFNRHVPQLVAQSLPARP